MKRYELRQGGEVVARGTKRHILEHLIERCPELGCGGYLLRESLPRRCRCSDRAGRSQDPEHEAEDRSDKMLRTARAFKEACGVSDTEGHYTVRLVEYLEGGFERAVAARVIEKEDSDE